MKSGAIAITLVPVKEIALSDEDALRMEGMIIDSSHTRYKIVGPGLGNFITLEVLSGTLFILPDIENGSVQNAYRIMNSYLVKYEEISSMK